MVISGPDGYIYDENGVNTPEKINYMLEMRASGRNKVQDYADKFGVPLFAGQKPWGVKADILMPCATQNEVHLDAAKEYGMEGDLVAGANIAGFLKVATAMKWQGVAY